jgi:5-methylcytosine-specific restriction protein A
MKVHGIELNDLLPWEIKALRDGLSLVARADRDVWAEVKHNATSKQRTAWRVLLRVRKYLTDLDPANTKSSRTFARDKMYPVRKDAEGHRLCRWCQKPVPRSRMSYCGEDCLREVDCRTNAGQLRSYVFARDKGVCAECGCDTEKIKRVVDYAGQSFKNMERYGEQLRRRASLGWWTQEVWAIYRAMGFNYHGHLWEADHVVAHSEGGESCLENVQTLCIPCHKAKTRSMHTTRKVERRVLVNEHQMSLI